MQKPDVDQIDGLSPAISIEQKTTSKNPRSTVGTVTEIYDYIGCYGRASACPIRPPPACRSKPDRLANGRSRAGAARRHPALPAGPGRARPQGRVRKELAEHLKKGFQRVKIDGKFHELAETPALDKKLPHDIDVVVDRIVVRPDSASGWRKVLRPR